jgi:hypothetical protein
MENLDEVLVFIQNDPDFDPNTDSLQFELFEHLS